MPSNPLSPLNEIVVTSLYSALKTPLGLKITTNDPQRARRLFYKLREELNDPSLDALSISFSPTSSDNEIWLLKKQAKVESQSDLQSDPETGIVL